MPEASSSGSGSDTSSSLAAFRKSEDINHAGRRTNQLKRKFETLRSVDLDEAENEKPSDISQEEMRKREQTRQEYARLLMLECRTAGPDDALSYERFRAYADLKEQELWTIFSRIDRNQDCHVDRAELQRALEDSKVIMSSQAVQEFFSTLDADNDGKISFADFREFLLLLPRPANLDEIVTFYRAAKPTRRPSHQVTQDGDVTVGEKPRPRSTSKAAPVNSQGVSSKAEAHKEKISESPEVKEEEKSLLDGSGKYLLAGGISGAVSRTATAPFDRLKVYLIVSNSSHSKVMEDAKILNPVRLAKVGSRSFAALSDACKAIYAEKKGLKGFFTGNGLNVIKIFPESAIKFLTYETAKRFFARRVDNVSDTSQISNTSRFISGGLGGMTSQFSIYPIETVKTRLQSSQGGPLSGTRLVKQIVTSMYTKGGIRPFFSGLNMGMLGVFPYAATDAALYELQKNWYCEYTGRDEPGVLASLLFGGLSGGIGATSVYPLNFIRTRLQAQGTSSHAAQYTGFRDVIRQTYAKQGLTGFYAGLSITLLKVAPSMAISWTCYDLATAYLFTETSS